MDRIAPNFIYAIILTRSMLGLLHISFCSLLPELWPLIYSNFVSAQYLENKWTDFDQTLLTIYTDKIYVGIVSCHFHKFVRELWPLLD